MVADALKLALSQRLVKKVCPRCYVEEPVPTKARLDALGIDPEWLKGISALRRGRRYEFCRNTGVSGRKPIFEMLVVDEEIKAAIQERAPEKAKFFKLICRGCSPPHLSATQLPSATDSQCSVRRGLAPRCCCALSGAPGPDLRAGQFTTCTPLSPGGSEIRPYQQPFSHICLAKYTRAFRADDTRI